MANATIIFTDLDGTLLDHEHYSWEAARPALLALRQLAIPLIFCSSKTRAEIEVLRTQLNNTHPFIVENGGAVFIPRDYFKLPLPDHRVHGQYRVIELGTPYPVLQQALEEIRQDTGIALRGCGQLSVEEFARLTGLTTENAALAKQREYDEPFLLETDTSDHQRLADAIAAKGVRWTRGGRLYHLTGQHDKGLATRMLSGLYRQRSGAVTTVGLGDSLNDLPMLHAVTRPIIVQRADGRYDPDLLLPGIERAPGIGPLGWNAAILGLLKTGCVTGGKTPLPP